MLFQVRCFTNRMQNHLEMSGSLTEHVYFTLYTLKPASHSLSLCVCVSLFVFVLAGLCQSHYWRKIYVVLRKIQQFNSKSMKDRMKAETEWMCVVHRQVRSVEQDEKRTDCQTFLSPLCIFLSYSTLHFFTYGHTENLTL